MAISYKQYLQRTGKPSTAAAAREWDRLHNDNKRFGPKPAPTATGTTPPPNFNFDGPLDEQGERERTDLDFSYRSGQSAIDTDYNAGEAELKAREPLLEQGRNEGLRSTDNNAAARGLLRSGIRDTNRGRVFSEFTRGNEAIARDRTNLANRRKSDSDRLNADYAQNTTNIRTGAVGRRWQRFREENGGL